METLVKQQVTIKTPELQDVISKAFKVCSMIEVLPVTTFLQLVCKDGLLTVTSTDGVNILKLTKGNIEGELNIVVDAKLFSALVAKITTPITQLVVEGNNLVVNANGKYNINIITEEDGSVVNLPTFEFNEHVASNHVSSNDLKTILTMNKSCKADMKEMPSLYNYYMDSERVVTTDFYKVCNNPVKVFNNPVCLTPELAELIPLVADENGVDAKENDNTVLFISKQGKLFGKKATQEDLDGYPITDLMKTFNEQYNYKCVINKTILMNALDRICLFTEGFENNKITLYFESEALTLKTSSTNTHEVIKYLEPSNTTEAFSIAVDGTFLKNQLASLTKEDLVIKFGNESGILLVNDKVIQILSSLDEEEE